MGVEPEEAKNTGAWSRMNQGQESEKRRHQPKDQGKIGPGGRDEDWSTFYQSKFCWEREWTKTQT